MSKSKPLNTVTRSEAEVLCEQRKQEPHRKVDDSLNVVVHAASLSLKQDLAYSDKLIWQVQGFVGDLGWEVRSLLIACLALFALSIFIPGISIAYAGDPKLFTPLHADQLKDMSALQTQRMDQMKQRPTTVSSVLTGVTPSSADEIDASCVANSTGSMTVPPSSVVSGLSTVLQWHVNAACADMVQTISGPGFSGVEPVASNGSRSVQVWGNGRWTLTISRYQDSAEIAHTSVAVQLPQEAGRTSVLITRNDQRDLFAQAVGVPGALVQIAGDVNLDLSGLANVDVAAGVQIIGRRETNPRGPRLFTTSFPHRLLILGDNDMPSDNVRITGVRFDGGQGDQSADSDADSRVGITVLSSVNVEIDHSELYGWSGAAVSVWDSPNDRINLANASTVHVHDNFIHHNQHYRKDGYGVQVELGSYALFDRNVFDYNRHAIEGDGRTGTGYLAYRNLILTNGGDNTSITNTHILDMHGTTEKCWKFPIPFYFEYYCGQAGEYMDIRYNTILYTDGTGFKLRGKPTMRADVAYNVFAESQVWGGWLDDAALVETEGTGIHQWGNQFGLNTMNESGWCDFDRDGVSDRFLATGATWWYNSSQLGHWVYLNTSTKKLSDLTLRDLDGDGRCDVTVDGVAYNGGGEGVLDSVNPFGSPIAVARDVNGRLEIFGTTNTDAVVHRAQSYIGNSWDPWSTFDGALRSVAAETNADGRMELFGVNGAGQIFHRWQTVPSGAWSGWVQLDGGLSSIAATRNVDGRLEIFGANSAGQVFHRWQTNPGGITWSDWVPFDGTLRQVAAETNANGRVELFGVNSQHAIVHRVQSSPGNWTGSTWAVFDGELSSIAATRNSDGRLELFGANSGGVVYHRTQSSPGNWTGSDWATFGSSAMSQIAAETSFDGRIQVIAVNSAGQVFGHMQDRPGQWLYPVSWYQFDGQLRTTSPITTVPNVLGDSQSSAMAALRSVGLVPGSIGTIFDCDNAGLVTSQSPGSGARVALGNAVNLVVGSTHDPRNPKRVCP